MDSFEQMLTCHAEAMQETLDYLTYRYRGIESYCRLIGLRDKEIRQIQQRLIE
jgi:hypothetical protein